MLPCYNAQTVSTPKSIGIFTYLKIPGSSHFKQSLNNQTALDNPFNPYGYNSHFHFSTQI